jgi:SAM-dependent methyltransferase
MDLRQYNLTPGQVNEAARVLDYQPFIISDDLQTGAAYSWLYSDDPRNAPKLIFRFGDSEWQQAEMANEALRKLYDGFLEQIAGKFPHASLFDVGCSNGYFAVRAETLGMRGTGTDIWRGRARSIAFLNSVLGTKARFVWAPYWPQWGRILTVRKFDVVTASAIMCHLPSPLDFLRALSRVARRAVFIWGQFEPGDDMAIFYRQPFRGWGRTRPFPYCFNDGTRMTRPLFDFAMRELGFGEIVELAEPSGALRLPHYHGLLAVRS